MDQIIALVFIGLLVYFVVKVGSFLWRIAGVLFLLFLLYTYKDQMITNIQSFLASPNLGGLWQQATDFVGNLWQKVIGFI
ncbi:hypothetical protein [Enterococcus pallens]|uniref:Uncharacterized protein n=1 Tax=Enterococcus pallens ATCC BAA-351 TaxID=1158607 RepID=R2QD92_9ENTE|nr:hypothetical protein [Enterococcus pallens]EOH94372.1 hypothetical protein UAU_02107 [Enterococcus pallens ATCC BAA-351]EOU24251.1 hypothetical protein I588_00238 [Enterococcus pallens ATCC BAA-351]